MSPPDAANKITVALMGNPNTGKSTLFGALAGMRQRVGNYPGVTVEKKIGRMEHDGHHFELVDLPGTYSLAPRSPDEMVAVDVLLGRRNDQSAPDVVLAIVDASNLERNLYLVSQLLELGLPTVLALNMVDVANSRGIVIDLERLREQLAIPVVAMQANRGVGLQELKDALTDAARSIVVAPESPFSLLFREEVSQLERLLEQEIGKRAPRYLVERLLLDTGGYISDHMLGENHAEVRQHLSDARGRLAAAGQPVPAVEAMARYQWVGQILQDVVTRPPEHKVTWSDRIDHVLTHKLWGTAFFALTMLVVFSSIFIVADAPMTWIDDGISAVEEVVAGSIPDGTLRSLTVDGVIAGVGAVVIFLPQILILFFFIAVLEDCGYMARAAYLMDKLMARAGLSGKSFIPLLSSFACAVPGIMATRVIENRRDRLTTILVAPLMSCSARLPVYTILIGAFIPPAMVLGVLPLRGLTFFCMYLVGIVVAVLVALVLKRTILKGETPPFVMELPSYKFPSPSIVLHRMGSRGWAFLRRAGTLIFAVSIVVWAATYYPRNEELVEKELAYDKAQLVERLDKLPADDSARTSLEEELAEYNRKESLEALRAGIQQRHSILGQMGHWIEPAVRPLGWDWRIGCAAIASFPAREVVMSVLGVIYNLGGELDVGEMEDQTRLQARLRAATWDDTGKSVYNIPVALSIMVFFALCAQCAATLAVIRRETNSWRWPAFTFCYMTALAYVGALVVYQGGMWLGLG